MGSSYSDARAEDDNSGACSPPIKKYGNCSQSLLKEIVRGVGTFVYYFQPDWNQKNMAWVSKDGTRPQIAKRSRTARKILCTIFFDTRGVVTQIPTPVGQSVTGNFYVTSMLPNVVEHYKE